MKADTFIRPGLDVRFTVVDEAAKIVPAIIGAWDAPSAPSDSRARQVLSAGRS